MQGFDVQGSNDEGSPNVSARRALTARRGCAAIVKLSLSGDRFSSQSSGPKTTLDPFQDTMSISGNHRIIPARLAYATPVETHADADMNRWSTLRTRLTVLQK